MTETTFKDLSPEMKKQKVWTMLTMLTDTHPIFRMLQRFMTIIPNISPVVFQFIHDAIIDIATATKFDDTTMMKQKIQNTHTDISWLYEQEKKQNKNIDQELENILETI